jgi:hypothetical protein
MPHDPVGSDHGSEGLFDQNGSFSNRRGPAKDDSYPPGSSTSSPTDQSIQGTDPFGKPVDLTPGQTPRPVPEPAPGPPPPPVDGGTR